MTQKGSWTDRHNIPSPTAGKAPAAKPTSAPTVDWAGFKNGVNTRIGELFKSEGGIPGHVTQIQQNLNRIDAAVTAGTLAKPIAKAMALELYKNCGKAAKAAKLDKWAKFTLKVQAAGQFFECEKANGTIKMKGA